MTQVYLLYSTNCNTVQIWSWCTQYLSTVLNRYPAIYVISYVRGKMFKSVLEIKVGKNIFFSCVINLSNNKTIILLNLAEYRLIFANSAYGDLRPRRLSTRQYSARFRRIIVKYRVCHIVFLFLSNQFWFYPGLFSISRHYLLWYNYPSYNLYTLLVHSWFNLVSLPFPPFNVRYIKT